MKEWTQCIDKRVVCSERIIVCAAGGGWGWRLTPFVDDDDMRLVGTSLFCATGVGLEHDIARDDGVRLVHRPVLKATLSRVVAMLSDP